MEKEYNLSRDPSSLPWLGFFALLTTGFPCVLGQPRFLPLVQAVALTLFLAVPLRQRNLRSALFVVFLWLALTMGTLLALTWFDRRSHGTRLRGRFSLPRGLCRMVLRRQRASSPLPARFGTQLLPSLVEIVGIMLGSLLTGGPCRRLVLVKAANLAAFGAATLASTLPNPLLAVVALPLWRILQVIGGGGLLVLLAEPLASGHFGAGLRQLAAAGACRCWSLAVCLCSAFCWNSCCRPFGTSRPSIGQAAERDAISLNFGPNH